MDFAFFFFLNTKVLELRLIPFLPADVELGTLCATAATFLFSSPSFMD